MFIKETIDGPNLYLRCVEEFDCNNTYLKWMNDIETNKYMETRWQPQTKESIVRFVLNSIESNHSILFAMIEKKTGCHIGNIKIGPIHPQYKYADVSYFIGEKKSRGKGYASEAVKLVIGYAFKEMKLHRLQAGIIDGNEASKKVLLKNGFSIEGRLRKQMLVDSTWKDHILFGLINDAN